MAAIGRKLRNRTILSGLPLGFAVFSGAAHALPQDGVVAAGAATITEHGSQLLTIDQSSLSAIIDWQSFDIAAGERVEVFQPSAAASLLNRVVGGGGPSAILGSLAASGQLTLINPSGIHIGAHAKIDVGALIATTIDIDNQDFLDGRYDFVIPGDVGARIVNEGQITAAEGGLVAFVAPGVENSGVIAARLGRVALGAGERFTLDLYGDDLIHIGVDDAVMQAIATDALISQQGSVLADGGQVLIRAEAGAAAVDRVINLEGVVQARSVGVEDGAIVLYGGDAGTVNVAGTLDASGLAAGERGGTIAVTGKQVAVSGDALLDASGSAGGGTVLVGGEYQGGGTLPTAQRSFVGTDAVLRADAVDAGDGGRVIVWADGDTRYHGTISARGGAASGDGGFVEVSGKQALAYRGAVDTGAANGAQGSLLLDPDTITIVDGAGGTDDGQVTGDGEVLFTDSFSLNFTISEQALENLTTADITLQANNAITINDLSDNELTLDQTGTVSFQSGIGGFTMNAGDQIHLTGTGSLVIDTTNASPGNISAGSLAVGTGNLTLIGESITIEGPSGTLGGNVTVTANNGITINGGISAPGGSTLSADIDANGTGNLTVNGLYDTQGSNGTVTASDVIITGTVTSGSATNNALLKFIQTQDGTIGLGDGAGAMNISGTELGKITTGALQFGNFPLTGGAITVDNVSAADTGNIGRIDLFSGQNVTFSGAASNFASNLRVLANGSTMVNSNLTTQATFTVSADDDANGSGNFSIAVGNTLNGQDTVSITANDALIDGSIAAPGSAISFNHASETGIALGTSTSGGMWLENAELARMSGDSLIIGSFASTAGPIDVVGVAAADFAGFTGSGGFAVSLLSGNTIAVTNPSSFSSLFVSGVGGQMRLSADLSVGKLDTLIPTLIDGNRSITGTDQIKLAAVDGQSFGSDNLTLNATNIVNVTGDIGISSPLSTVTATANAITLHDVTTLDDQTYTGAVSFNSSYETNGGDFTINGPGTIDGPGFLLDLFSGNALFTGPLNAGTSTGPHDVQIFVNNGGTITFQDDVGGTMPLSSFALIDVNSTAPTGNATLKNVTTSGFQSYSLPVNVSSTYQGTDIFFSNGITVAGGSNLTVNATGRIDIAGAVNSANGTPFDVTLNADTPQTGTDDEGVFLTGANFNLSGGNFNSGGLFTDIFETLISSAANVTLRGREDVTVASSAVLAENDISIIGTAGGPGDFIVGETGTPPLPSLVPGQSIFDAGNNVLISAALKNSNFPGDLGISAGNLLTFTATNSGGIGVNSAFGIFNLDTSGDLFAPNLIINSPDAIQVGAFDINGNESNITDSVSFNVTSTLGELDFVGGQMNFPVLNGSSVRAITVAAPLMTTGNLSLIADSAGNNPDGHVHIQNDLTSGGNLTLSGATDGLKVETNNPTLQANQTVSLIGALESPFGNNSLTVASMNGSVFLFDDTSQTLPLGGLTINAGSEIALQDVTSVGPQSYTGLTRFNSDYVTNGSDFTITGNTIVNADSSVTTGGGNILFTGDINSGVTIADLLLNANGASSSGTVTLNGPVGNAFPLDSLGLFGASGTLSGDRIFTNSGITIGTNLAINLANPTTGFEQEFLFAADFNRDGTGLFSVTSSGSISDPSFAGIVILAADVDIAGPVSSNDIVDISATGSLGLGNATGQQMTIDNGELSRITSPDSIFLGTDIVVDGVDLRNIGFLGLYTGVLDPTAFTPQNLSLPDGFAEIDTLVDFSNGADITFTGAPSQFSEIEILATDNIQFNSNVSGQNGFSLFLADLDQNGTGTIGIAPQAQVRNLTAQEGIVFAAADIDLQGSVTTNADSGRVAISSRGGTTSVGSASGGLSLSGAELSVISTNELGITGDDIILGDVSADQTANINQLGVATAILDIDRIFIEELENATADFETNLSQYFSFSNAGSVLFNGTIFAVQDLAVRARDAIGVSAGIQSSGGVLLTAGFLAPNNPDARIALNADIQADLGIRLESGPGGLFIDGTVNLASNGPVGLQGIAQSSGSPGNLNITTTNAPVLLENDTSATAPLASLTIDAGTANIALQDVTTVGPQNYTGNVFFNSIYRTNGNNFTATGNVGLLSNTAILTSNGNVSLGPVNGTQDLIIDAGNGNILFSGNVGGAAALGTLTIASANNTILNGTMRVGSLVQSSGTGLTNLGFNSLAATGDVAINTGNLTGRIGGTNVTLVASGSLGSPEQPLQLIADNVTVTSQSAFLNVLPPADSDPNTQVPVNFVGPLGSGPFILNNTDFTAALLNNTPENDFGIGEEDLNGFETVDEIFDEANDTISNVIDDVANNDGGDPLATAEEESADDTLQNGDGPVQNNADLIFTDLVEDEGFEDSNFRLVSENAIGPIADDEEEDEDSAAGCACN